MMITIKRVKWLLDY